MTSAIGLPQTSPQRPPWSRGKKELVLALAALPVLLAAGVYLGGRISSSGSDTLKPAAGVASPLVTVVASPPAPVVTVKPAAPGPVATVKPATPGPVVTVRAPAVPRFVLGRGSTGAEVRAWQEQMARRTWRIRVDGIFGPESERVARQFQRNKGLRVDGLVGRQTWDAAWRLPVIR